MKTAIVEGDHTREEKPMDNVESRGSGVEQGEKIEGAQSTEYELSGIRLFLVMVGLSLAVFLTSIDASIISTAIPRITSHFHSTDDIGWYGSTYALTLCALQPLAGKLYSLFSLKVGGRGQTPCTVANSLNTCPSHYSPSSKLAPSSAASP